MEWHDVVCPSAKRLEEFFQHCLRNNYLFNVEAVTEVMAKIFRDTVKNFEYRSSLMAYLRDFACNHFDSWQSISAKSLKKTANLPEGFFYMSTGRSYDTTLCFDPYRNRIFIAAWGDIIERHGRKERD